MLLKMQLPLTPLHESIIPARSPIISPQLQAAQQDATADIANNPLFAGRPKIKQLHHEEAQQGATARCKTAKCKYLVAVM